MQSLKEALNVFVTKVTNSVDVYSTVTGLFFYHVVFDKDLQCACEVQTVLRWFYMILPAIIILFMLLLLDGSFQRILKYSCLKGKGKFCCFLVLWIIRAIFISLLWPLSVMMDGDWFICYYDEMKLDCRESNQTDVNKMSIKELKNDSRVIGFSLLLGIVVVAAILHCVPWMECCTRCKSNESTANKESNESTANRESNESTANKESNESTANKESNESEYFSKYVLFKKVVLEESENLVTSKLIEIAKEKINDKLNKYDTDGEWWKCYDVVGEIIGPPQQQNPTPTKSASKSTTRVRNDGNAGESDQSHLLSSESSPEATTSV